MRRANRIERRFMAKAMFRPRGALELEGKGAISFVVFSIAVLILALHGGEAHGQQLTSSEVTCAGLASTKVGTRGSDVLLGTRDPDVIHGLGGNDTIRGRRGEDTICGGRGRDRLFGQRGDDTLFGQRGNDALNGGRGSDSCKGGRGRDTKVRCERVDVAVNDRVRCFNVAFRRFARELRARFTVLSNNPNAGGRRICQIDFLRYNDNGSNTLFRAKVDLARRRIISTQVVRNTQPDVSPAEVAEARNMAEVGALANRITETPGLVVTALGGSGILQGSRECITDRCVELRYYGAAGTGTAPVPEPLGATFTFTNQQVVAIAVVDLTLQTVLQSEVVP